LLRLIQLPQIATIPALCPGTILARVYPIKVAVARFLRREIPLMPRCEHSLTVSRDRPGTILASWVAKTMPLGIGTTLAPRSKNHATGTARILLGPIGPSV